MLKLKHILEIIIVRDGFAVTWNC